MIKKNSIPHLLLAIDTGASLIKVVASIAGSPDCHVFALEPYCVNLTETEEPIPALKKNFDSRSVWVKVKDEYYAVGNLAQTKYNAFFSVKPLKNDNIVPKIIAAVAVAHKHFNLPPKFKLSIVAVLPPSEYTYSQDVGTELLNALDSIETPAGQIFPRSPKVNVYPEGYGILTYHDRAELEENICVIMCGFRNTSILFSTDGQLNGLKTSDYGFYSMLEQISATSGGYKEVDLIEPVYQYLTHKKDYPLAFDGIFKSKDNVKEFCKLTDSIKKAHTDYSRNLVNWIESVMRKTDRIIFAGGTAEIAMRDTWCDLKRFVKPIEDDKYKYPIGRHLVDRPARLIAAMTDKPDSIERYLDIYELWDELRNTNL